MMNKFLFMGRLTKKVEVRYTQSAEPMAVAVFSLAVDGNKKDEVDFIQLKAFGSVAERLEKYTDKGVKILTEGHIKTGSYDKDGKRVYTTDFMCDRFEFCESKGARANNEPAAADGFVPVDDNIEEELPFM